MTVIKSPQLFPDFTHTSADYLIHRITNHIESQRSAIAEIRSIPLNEANFSNTIEALERLLRLSDPEVNTYFNLFHACATDDLVAHVDELSDLLSDFGNEVDYDQELAARIREVYEHHRESLPADQRRLTQRTFEGHRRRGAYLNSELRESLMQIRKELSRETVRFSANLLRESSTLGLHVTDPEELHGIPQSDLDLAEGRAAAKGLTSGYWFDTSMPSYLAILKHADSRELRKRMYRLRREMCADPERESCNIDLLSRISGLRREYAQILGYPSYAAYVLEDRMAKSPAKVFEMLDDLRDSFMPLAEREVQAISDFASTSSDIEVDQLMPWDWTYYAEKYMYVHFAYDEEATRPYFELTRVVESLFGLAGKLYGLTFTPDERHTLYHPDVRLFEVRREGEVTGYLMLDFYARPGKQPGAWMTEYIEAYEDQRPVVSLVMNFTPPSGSKPSLLTFDECNTLYHEFGHSLHALLTRVRYSSLSGTSVTRDFVELPSQIMENWIRHPEYLREVAWHHLTGERIPDEIFTSILHHIHFLEGYATIRQLNFGYLDMAWHGEEEVDIPNLDALQRLEKMVEDPIRLLPHTEFGAISTSFSHIFSGGYAAGYYGYKWAEILDADAFEEFEREGIYSRKVADRFRSCVLERGDLEDAGILYRNFKGHEPSAEALKRRGLKDSPLHS